MNYLYIHEKYRVVTINLFPSITALAVMWIKGIASKNAL